MNKSKAIIITMLLALMSAIILVTASVALFSKSVTVENYLQAGTLEVGLARTSLRGQIPDADGGLAAGDDELRSGRSDCGADGR